MSHLFHFLLCFAGKNLRNFIYTKILRYFSYLIYSSTLWVKYGLVKEASFLVNVNSIGAFLNFLFAFIYYIYTSQKVCKSHIFAILSLVLATFFILFFQSLLHKQLIAAYLFMYPILLWVKYNASNKGEAIHVMGVICSMFAVLAYASPLASLVSKLNLF